MLSKDKKNKSTDNQHRTVSQKAFKNLAINNVKNSINNYMIYFITLTFGVCLLYSFNSIDKQFEFFGNSYLLEAYINMARGVIIFASVIICAIFAFLINYANQLLMRRRKREFGIYITLGMNKRDIINIMFKETIIIGSISFGVGILLGMFVEQGLSIITANMIGLDPSLFKFGISISALIKTAVLFLVVLLLINIFNKRTIKKYELIELLNSHKKNEFTESKGKIKSIFVFFISIVIILCGYLIMINDITSIKKLGISLVFIIIGTYYFFLSIADFLISIIKKNKRAYYKNLNMFVISQISSRLKTMSSTITAICLILFLAATIIPMGLGISKDLIKDIKEATPYDVTISRYNTSKEFSYEKNESDNSTSIRDELLSQKFPLNNLTRSYSEVNVYTLSDVNMSTIGVENYIKDKKYSGYVYVVKLSEFNSARKQQGLGEIKLEEDEFVLNSSDKEIRDIYEKYLKKNNEEIQVNNKILKPGPNIAEGLNYMTTTLLSDAITVVVNDNVVDNLVPKYSYLNLNYIESNNEYENMFLKEYYNINTDLYMYDSKIIINGEKISMNISFSYISLYLGIILFITAGAVLALHQVSESITTKERFSLLKKLGVKKKDREKAIFTQTWILYSLPLTLAIIHSLFVNIGVAISVEEYLGRDIISKLLLTFIILFLVYGTYFIISYRESKNNID